MSDVNVSLDSGSTNSGNTPTALTVRVGDSKVPDLATNAEHRSSQDRPIGEPGPGVSDLQFIGDLKALKNLRSFFIREAVSVSGSEAHALALGNLNRLYYEEGSRRPTIAEWAQVEQLTQELFGYMTEQLRRKYILGTIPWWISALPILLTVVALVSLISSVYFGTGTYIKVTESEVIPTKILQASEILPYYTLWLLSVGGIGAVAFIGMNALSVQQDITFDLTNTRLMILRIVLGGLFALILTLPFGFEHYATFCFNIGQGKFLSPDQVTTQALMLILPFILGFSTPLVITILNQFVEAVQAFFGKRPAVSPAPAAAPAKILISTDFGSSGLTSPDRSTPPPTRAAAKRSRAGKQ
ncbi:MAG TPA: hypothetical protein VFQ87_17145 [Bradyrhizobium sp.]|jgi:hypothetical protein|nr:hypothetical protein [Bradyrhizobium sp.]